MSVEIINTDWIPITKLKQDNLFIELKSYFDFKKIYENKTLNPSQIVWKDNEKLYFSDDNKHKKTYYMLLLTKVVE